ncbi:MAG: ArsC/Spx/MgsR family protein [Bacteroidia bacterium]|nr:ArsC/Spx/MgsR family protein [Bacteroidia bacterium]
MTKIYTLANCTTSQRILKEIGPGPEFVFQNIKEDKITPEQLDELYRMVGSYEALFSKRALKYKDWGLNKMTLTEDDYRRYILEEYTFLKRPVIVSGKKIFIGNAPKVVEAAKKALKE